jgi:hypothetical protein
LISLEINLLEKPGAARIDEANDYSYHTPATNNPWKMNKTFGGRSIFSYFRVPKINEGMNWWRSSTSERSLLKTLDPRQGIMIRNLPENK